MYDVTKADHAVNFINCLKHTKGKWRGVPFELLSWQDEIIRTLFGTVKENGYRQYNTCYCEIPKKNGKSELAAAIALYMTCGDGEWGAEVYGCASDRQQASIVFDVAVDMVDQCPALKKRIKPVMSVKRLVYKPTNSFYQVLSAEAYTKHGLNVHAVIFDELHAQPNRELFDVMTKGSGDVICTLFTGHPVRRVFLCATLMSTKENVWKCIGMVFTLKLQKGFLKRHLRLLFANGIEWRTLRVLMP